MSLKKRLEKIKKKLSINKKQDSYVIFLWVDKNTPFEEALAKVKGEYPLFIKKELKEKYEDIQNEIKNDPKVGGVLLLDLLKKRLSE